MNERLPESAGFLVLLPFVLALPPVGFAVFASSPSPSTSTERTTMTDDLDRRIHPSPETKVFSRLDGEPGTILNRVSPDAYEVMTDRGHRGVAGRGHPGRGRGLTSSAQFRGRTRNTKADRRRKW